MCLNSVGEPDVPYLSFTLMVILTILVTHSFTPYMLVIALNANESYVDKGVNLILGNEKVGI